MLATINRARQNAHATAIIRRNPRATTRNSSPHMPSVNVGSAAHHPSLNHCATDGMLVKKARLAKDFSFSCGCELAKLQRFCVLAARGQVYQRSEQNLRIGTRAVRAQMSERHSPTRTVYANYSHAAHILPVAHVACAPASAVGVCNSLGWLERLKRCGRCLVNDDKFECTVCTLTISI